MPKTTFPTSIAHLTPLRVISRHVRSLNRAAATAPKIPTSARPAATRRGTLRDLYTAGLVSVFRSHSVLRVWEPLRETQRRSERDPAL